MHIRFKNAWKAPISTLICALIMALQTAIFVATDKLPGAEYCTIMVTILGLMFTDPLGETRKANAE